MGELSSVRLICMDMDGTLLDGKGIPPLNLTALRECDRRGIRLALVSGRNFRFLTDSASQIGPNVSIVSANGARIDVMPEKECIYEGTFDEAYARFVCDALFETGVYFELYTESTNYVFNTERISKIHKRSLESYLKNKQILGLEFPEDPGRTVFRGIYKYVAFSDDPEMIARVKARLDEAGIAHSSSWWDNVEVMAPGVGKGQAVERLGRYFGISRSDVMAFGDQTNDLSLLRAAGWPVAMQNGVDEVKRVARIVAPPNTESGVGQVIFRYVLETDVPENL